MANNENNLDAYNEVEVALGGAGAQPNDMVAVRAIAVLEGASGGPASASDDNMTLRLNAIDLDAGGTGLHLNTLDALNSIVVLKGGAGGHENDLDAINEWVDFAEGTCESAPGQKANMLGTLGGVDSWEFHEATLQALVGGIRGMQAVDLGDNFARCRQDPDAHSVDMKVGGNLACVVLPDFTAVGRFINMRTKAAGEDNLNLLMSTATRLTTDCAVGAVGLAINLDNADVGWTTPEVVSCHLSDDGNTNEFRMHKNGAQVGATLVVGDTWEVGNTDGGEFRSIARTYSGFLARCLYGQTAFLSVARANALHAELLAGTYGVTEGDADFGAADWFLILLDDDC